jgi:uroporphyrinogen III methyltransferase/synthase
VTPERFVAEGLVDALADVRVRHALVVRAREGRDVLATALRAHGAKVDELAGYETVPEPLGEVALNAAREADYIAFASSSSVRFFLRAAETAGATGSRAGLSERTRVVSIGPVTSQTLREHGLSADVEASRHDVDGIVEALLADAAARAPDGPPCVRR